MKVNLSDFSLKVGNGEPFNSVANRYIEAEQAFFRALGIEPPDCLYAVHDRRDYYWSCSQPGLLLQINGRKPGGDRCFYYVHPYWKEKGEVFELEDVFVFKIGYTVRGTNYETYLIFSKEKRLEDKNQVLNLDIPESDGARG